MNSIDQDVGIARAEGPAIPKGLRSSDDGRLCMFHCVHAACSVLGPRRGGIGRNGAGATAYPTED